YKLSPVDKESQKLWDKYTIAKFSMLMSSNTDICPWTIVRSDNKKAARINCIKHILNRVDYPNQLRGKLTEEDSNIIVTGSEEIKLMEKQNTFAKVL
ncbi:MAG: polyphosphate kinase 2, partial [Arcobacteraceae bacterium]